MCYSSPAGASHLSHPHSWMTAGGGLIPKDQRQRIRKRQAAAVVADLVKRSLDVAGVATGIWGGRACQADEPMLPGRGLTLPSRGLAWPSGDQRSTLTSLHSTLFLPSPVAHTQFTHSPICLNVGRLLKVTHSPLSPVRSWVHRQARILQVPKSLTEDQDSPKQRHS